MSNYIDYIDQELIEEGNLFYQKGDYLSAGIKFQTAFNKLRDYEGDSTLPIMIAAQLKQKIDYCKGKTGETYFKTSPSTHYIPKKKDYILSKSTYIRGLQCYKSLYLNKHFPKLRTPPSKETMILFGKGRDFEAKFKATFEKALDVKAFLGNSFDDYPFFTESLLNQSFDFESGEHETVLFEAGFIFNEILVLTDVLKQNADGSFSIFEVKLSTEMNNTILSDLSIQYYVCKSKLKNIKDFNVVLRTADDNFNVIDFKDALEENITVVEENIKIMKTILNKVHEPKIDMGQHCEKPYQCDYKEYCLKQNSKAT